MFLPAFDGKGNSHNAAEGNVVYPKRKVKGKVSTFCAGIDTLSHLLFIQKANLLILLRHETQIFVDCLIGRNSAGTKPAVYPV